MLNEGDGIDINKQVTAKYFVMKQFSKLKFEAH